MRPAQAGLAFIWRNRWAKARSGRWWWSAAAPQAGWPRRRNETPRQNCTVRLVESGKIGIVGVGEGGGAAHPHLQHRALGLDEAEFVKAAGARSARRRFHRSFSRSMIRSVVLAYVATPTISTRDLIREIPAPILRKSWAWSPRRKIVRVARRPGDGFIDAVCWKTAGASKATCSSTAPASAARSKTDAAHRTGTGASGCRATARVTVPCERSGRRARAVAPTRAIRLNTAHSLQHRTGNALPCLPACLAFPRVRQPLHQRRRSGVRPAAVAGRTRAGRPPACSFTAGKRNKVEPQREMRWGWPAGSWSRWNRPACCWCRPASAPARHVPGPRLRPAAGRRYSRRGLRGERIRDFLILHLQKLHQTRRFRVLEPLPRDATIPDALRNIGLFRHSRFQPGNSS